MDNLKRELFEATLADAKRRVFFAGVSVGAFIMLVATLIVR